MRVTRDMTLILQEIGMTEYEARRRGEIAGRFLPIIPQDPCSRRGFD